MWVPALALALAVCTLAVACDAAVQVVPPAAGGAAGGSAGSAGANGVATDAQTERIARQATWASGQLRAHFQKHGREGNHRTAEAYDSSARETIRVGRQFTYVDRESRARRMGFYDPPSNRFTAVTSDGRRITTHFYPDTRERYVRGLQQSTYRSS
jgi:pyocin large subunit-like protein